MDAISSAKTYRLDWAYALGEPVSRALLRKTFDDFRVVERPAFEPSGQGEFLYMRIQKRGANTHWVAERLAEIANLEVGDIGYAGLKDRNAITTQWFSLPVAPERRPSWSILGSEGIEVIEFSRHPQPLRPGMLLGNHFDVTLRDLDHQDDVLKRLKQVKALGVPNYFGPQRFGRDGHNLDEAQALFDGGDVRDRHKRGLYLSAARSYLFNSVLHQRVLDDSWNKALPGEALLSGMGNERFIAPDEQTVLDALVAFEIHPSGPLWGEGELDSRDQARALEESVLSDFASWREGLEQVGMRQDRRALRMPVSDLDWDVLSPEVVRVRFSLPTGCYATSVLRELVQDAR